MQPPDPIPTPRAWPIVCVMSASHSHPSPRGDSHQGPYGKDWEESCNWSSLLSPNRSNTSGRTTVPAELCAHVWVCWGARVPVCVNWGSIFICKCLSRIACVCCDIGRVDVNIWEKTTKTVVRDGTKDGGLTLNMWLYVRSGHGCGYNTWNESVVGWSRNIIYALPSYIHMCMCWYF